jgi:hypothetical protein
LDIGVVLPYFLFGNSLCADAAIFELIPPLEMLASLLTTLGFSFSPELSGPCHLSLHHPKTVLPKNEHG